MLHAILDGLYAIGDRLMPASPAPDDGGLDESELRSQHDAISDTISKTFNTLALVSLYCAVTLGSPDVALLSTDAKVSMPVINFEVSYDAFLLAGPVFIVGLTAGLHIFLSHLRTYSRLDPRKRKPTLFNIDAGMPGFARWILFYWMPLIILAIFAWKARPRPIVSAILFCATILAGMLLVWLQGRRCLVGFRRAAIPGLLVLQIVLAGLLGLGLLGEIPFRRALFLYAGQLDNKDMRGFDLDNSILESASLQRTNLDHARLRDANLTAANLSGASLQEAALAGAILDRATLSGTNLAGADLSGAVLSGAVFGDFENDVSVLHRANLQGADLSGATFENVAALRTACNWMLARYDATLIAKLDLPRDHANRVASDAGIGRKDGPLGGMNLADALLCGARLDDFVLRRVNLPRADLTGATFQRADLWSANLNGAKLPRANLSDAILAQALLVRADLRGATMSRANLKFADLRAANLSGALLTGANLSQSNLTGADLSAAVLWDARLAGADLEGVVLEGTDLQFADLRGVRNLDCGVLVRAHHWGLSLRDPALGCGAQIPRAPR